MVDHQQIAGARLVLGNSVNGTTPHVVITRVKGIHRRIGVWPDRHVDRGLRAERVVERAKSPGDGAILVVALVLALPVLPCVEGAVAAEERIPALGLDEPELRIGPRETIGRIGEWRKRNVAGPQTLFGSIDDDVVSNPELAQLRDLYNRSGVLCLLCAL